MRRKKKMTDAIIFDIDGTLADVNHRRHHVQGGKRNWDTFFKEMVNDPPISDVCMLANLISNHPLVTSGQTKLFLLSGRPDNYRSETEKWLNKYVTAYFEEAEALMMRLAGDYRPDTEVKREMLNRLRDDGYNVRLVVDDRPSVIEMWKSEGITVLAHDSGEWGDAKPKFKPGVLSLMVGPSGAGKSHLIKYNMPIMKSWVVSTDQLRQEIAGDYRDQSENNQVFYALHQIVKARINSGLHCVVDATNLRARDRRSLRDLCSDDTHIKYFVVDRPLADKHRDAGWRDDVDIEGVKLIDKHHQSFQSGLKYILRGDDDPRVEVNDMRST
jgi:predicted kinase